MPATRYKIWGWGSTVNQGMMEACHVGIAGLAKRGNDAHPYVVANEFICSELARAILLPVPPGFIVEREDEPYFVSLNFNLAGEDLPPADCDAVVAADPRLCCGIVLFDIWVVNGDRHDKNLAFDKPSSRVQIFDHSNALFFRREGKQHWAQNQDKLGIGTHCIASRLKNADWLPEWHERILAIPEFYIAETVASATDIGMSPDDSDFLAEFLLDRRCRLMELVSINRREFPEVQSGLWDSLSSEEGHE